MLCSFWNCCRWPRKLGRYSDRPSAVIVSNIRDYSSQVLQVLETSSGMHLRRRYLGKETQALHNPEAAAIDLLFLAVLLLAVPFLTQWCSLPVSLSLPPNTESILN
jgi:hypothetical protein